MTGYEDGTVRRQVLSAMRMDRAVRRYPTAAAQDLITRHWGDIWTRRDWTAQPVPDPQAALVARGHHDELAPRARRRHNGYLRQRDQGGAVADGLYCSVPEANTAFRIIPRVGETGTPDAHGSAFGNVSVS